MLRSLYNIHRTLYVAYYHAVGSVGARKYQTWLNQSLNELYYPLLILISIKSSGVFLLKLRLFTLKR